MNSAEILKILGVEHAAGTSMVTILGEFRFGTLRATGTITLMYPAPELAAWAARVIVAQSLPETGPARYEESYTAPDGEKVVLAKGRIFRSRGKGDAQ